MKKEACIIATGRWGKKNSLFKNRDRNYEAKIEVVHEVCNGVEIAYLHDIMTDWCEGLNQYGIGIVNSALLVGRDEAEKKIVKSVGKKSVDGKIIRKALSCDNFEDAVDVLCSHKGGVHGHTFVRDTIGNCVSIESTSKHECIVKKISISKIHVRTNHGINYTDAGYTGGANYISSISRRDQAQRALRKVKRPQDISLALMEKRKKDRNHPNNMVRDTENMSTTSQMTLNLDDLLLSLYLIHEKSEYVGIKNKLKEGYKPKIKVSVFSYKEDDKGSVKLHKEASLKNLLFRLRDYYLI